MNDTPPPHHDTTPCSAVRAVLGDFVADETDALTSARVEAHAAACVACALALESARSYRRRMRRLGDAEPASAALRAQAALLAQQARDAG
ncbi:MAG: zf-HC2 domain-containing protein [Gemmatimonadaceae bacterium]|nr:zf-HC2 domain-containing protein [Gemmatimonadaceae bacterium]MCW5826664.1 zf-HC2 domain-containing protein [Gemmatimonadaceae bacterium]